MVWGMGSANSKYSIWRSESCGGSLRGWILLFVRCSVNPHSRVPSYSRRGFFCLFFNYFTSLKPQAAAGAATPHLLLC